MSLPIKHPSIRTWCLPFISALAILVGAAAVDPDQNWVRLRGLSVERRARLVENLKKFDLLYSRQKQDSLRELDRRIHELAPGEQGRYLTALRRYHNWLNQLPETKQDELNEQPPAERMAAVKKLVTDYPMPKGTTPWFVQVVDVDEYSPFELASLYKIWQAMPAQRRAQVEKVAAVAKRHEVMRKVADNKDIPHEIKPGDFDDIESTKRFEDHAKVKRPVLLLNELKKKEEGLRTEIVRRQAINYYFLEHPPAAVTPERLADFLAAFPPWLQSAFDHHPPDEAARRLTIVYRLVFPAPLEMKPPQRSSTPAPAARAAAEQRGDSPRPNGKPAARSDKSPF